jgi:hypothetical protein
MGEELRNERREAGVSELLAPDVAGYLEERSSFTSRRAPTDSSLDRTVVSNG